MGHLKGKEVHASPLTGIPILGDLSGGCLLQGTRGIALSVWCPRGDNRHIVYQCLDWLTFSTLKGIAKQLVARLDSAGLTNVKERRKGGSD